MSVLVLTDQGRRRGCAQGLRDLGSQLSAGSALRMGLVLALQAATWFCAQLTEVPAAGPTGDVRSCLSGSGLGLSFAPSPALRLEE